jgi:hypothetical protein
MSSQPFKSKNPFRNPSPNDEPVVNDSVHKYEPDLTLAFEDLSLQPGSDAQLQNLYAGMGAPSYPPPA